MKAWIDNRKGVGYVVMWTDGYTHLPLRCFGQMQSAAMEFRNWLNRCTDERLQRWVRLYADTFKPEEKFSEKRRKTLLETFNMYPEMEAYIKGLTKKEFKEDRLCILRKLDDILSTSNAHK